MRSLGDKISADVPTVAQSGTGISETIISEHGLVTVTDAVVGELPGELPIHTLLGSD